MNFNFSVWNINILANLDHFSFVRKSVIEIGQLPNIPKEKVLMVKLFARVRKYSEFVPSEVALIWSLSRGM
jgi:hypothetical protein